MEATKKTVVVAGAAGFVGSPLIERLARRFRVIALSRGARPSGDGIEWRQCDLLSSRDARAALAGADLAIYLVHSMLPGDRLVQGSFEDFDLQAADNFARACAAQGIGQIVYLGGLLPADIPRERLSRHLRSRAEVEIALAGQGVPVTVLRAGIVLGAGGSSTEIMLRLAKRLPVMVCPSWTTTPTQPIALDDVLALLEWVLGREDTFGETYDIGGPEVVTYRKLMVEAGAQLGHRPRTLSVPLITPRLSRLWITLVTGAPKELAAPLVESLSHTMIAADRRLQERAGIPGRPLGETLRDSIEHQTTSSPRAFRGSARQGPRVVRSVQRMSGTSADPYQAAAAYPSWLSAVLRPLIHVDGDPTGQWRILVGSPRRRPALSFAFDATASATDRVVYDITGGFLAARGTPGRFELRSVLNGTALLCSVHGFSPRLWWPIYLVTQAQIHLVVMHAFARYLRRRFPAVQPSA
jgi:uncharacterized protein YbjT (DUF2867 family)